MTTITKERLLTIKQWRETYGPGSNVVLPAEEAEELARIALASLEAEPDYIRYECCRCGWETIEDWRENDVCPKCNHKPMGTTALYTATPAPAVPAVLERLRAIVADPRALPRRKEWVSGQQYSYVLLENVEAMVDEACHATMLQGSQPVSQTYKLNELSGNSPVTPDGWISCSDRMPEDTKMLLAFSQGQIVAAYWNWVMSPIDYKKYRAFTYLSGNILDDVTHWMPLPEPPQGVNRG